jgi:Helix-turn-helix domain
MPRKSRTSTGRHFGILGAVCLNDEMVRTAGGFRNPVEPGLAVSESAPPRMPGPRRPSRKHQSRMVHLTPYSSEGTMENTSNILTVKEVADILRCSKAHVHNALYGKVQGLPKLTHLTMGRRKLVRRDWLEQWLESNKTR